MIMTRDEAKIYARSQLETYLRQQCGVENTSRNFRCLCSNHRDSTPSMSLDKDKQHVHCFGCGAHMDIFDLVGEQFGLTAAADKFDKTFELLGISIDKPQIKKDIEHIIERAYNGRKNAEAIAYLKQRGISEKTAERFNIGYIPDFKTMDANKKPITIRAVIIPTEGGAIARNIDKSSDKDRVRKIKVSTIFNANRLLSEDTPVFIVEGEFDALSIEELGYHAVALGSVSNVDKFIKAYKAIGARAAVCVSMDNDSAGQTASDKLTRLLQDNGIPYAISNIAGKYKDANERLVNDRDGLKQALETALTLEYKTHNENNADSDNSAFDLISAYDLMQKDLPPIYWTVENFLPQGLAVLASPPKYGKSWLVLDLCLSVTTGKSFLGMPTNKSDVLYLSLEDSEKRLQERIAALVDNPPPNFYMTTAAHTLGNGLIKQLANCITAHKDIRLIVIDTLEKVRNKAKTRNAYSDDYKDLGELQKFAIENAVCILVVHHTNKGKGYISGDGFIRISGTNGIMGAADTAIMLSRQKREDDNAKMSITGRDIGYSEYILKFENSCKWRMIGNSDDETEKQEMEAYKNNPIVVTVKHLLSSVEIWKGTANELNAEIENYTAKTINDNPNINKLSYALKRLSPLLLDFDNIQYSAPRGVRNGCNADNGHNGVYTLYRKHNEI